VRMMMMITHRFSERMVSMNMLITHGLSERMVRMKMMITHGLSERMVRMKMMITHRLSERMVSMNMTTHGLSERMVRMDMKTGTSIITKYKMGLPAIISLILTMPEKFKYRLIDKKNAEGMHTLHLKYIKQNFNQCLLLISLYKNYKNLL